MEAKSIRPHGLDERTVTRSDMRLLKLCCIERKWGAVTAAYHILPKAPNHGARKMSGTVHKTKHDKQKPSVFTADGSKVVLTQQAQDV